MSFAKTLVDDVIGEPYINENVSLTAFKTGGATTVIVTVAVLQIVGFVILHIV